eukprot:m.25813 g.25813  ORF g.25813 m.25813 type:complete len:65 (-) comp7739_c0_seq3:2437-2631(-)
MSEREGKKKLDLVLPNEGIVFNNMETEKPILCKPKILPLKSVALQRQLDLAKQATQKQEPTVIE